MGWYVLDANIFIDNTGQIDHQHFNRLLKDLLPEIQCVITSSVADETHGKIDTETVNIIEIDRTAIADLIDEVGMDRPPQDNDLSLVLAARDIQRKYGIKYTPIISDDYTLFRFVENMNDPAIEVIPNMVFCFQLAVKSPNPGQWRRLGKSFSDSFIDYTIERQKQYPPKARLKWPFTKLFQLLEEQGQDHQHLIGSNSDKQAVYNLLKEEGDVPIYLTEIKKHLQQWMKHSSLESGMLLAQDFVEASLVKNISEKQISQIQTVIALWNDLLLSCNHLTEFSRKLLRTICYEQLLKLNGRLIDYHLKFTSEGNIEQLFLRRIQLASFLENHEVVLKTQLQMILNNLRKGDMENSKQRIQSALFYHKAEGLQEAKIVFAYLQILLEVDPQENREVIQSEFSRDKASITDSLQKLCDTFLDWGLYQFTYRLLYFLLIHDDYHDSDNTRRIILRYKQALLCDQLTNNKELRILENLGELKSCAVDGGNEDLIQFFHAEMQRTYQPPKTRPYVLDFPYEKRPMILKGLLDCILVDNELRMIISCQGKLFRIIEIDPDLINLDLKLHPYNYQIELPEQSLEIVNSENGNKWIQGDIRLQKSLKIIPRM